MKKTFVLLLIVAVGVWAYVVFQFLGAYFGRGAAEAPPARFEPVPAAALSARFRAPLDTFHMEPEPPFVAQLLSDESLRRTGYFDIAAVRHWRRAFRQMPAGSFPRLSVEMGLVAVVATQLWHHLFIDGQLCELPSTSRESAVRMRPLGHRSPIGPILTPGS